MTDKDFILGAVSEIAAKKKNLDDEIRNLVASFVEETHLAYTATVNTNIIELNLGYKVASNVKVDSSIDLF